MTASTYQQISLDWSPESQSDKQFNLITVVVLATMLISGLIISSLPLPVEKREARLEIPERIANILLEKKKARKEVIKPEPIVKSKPKPKLKPEPKKPKVKKLIKDRKQQKPLNQVQKKARQKAQESGLIALSKELEDLMDTSDISVMIGGKLQSNKSSSLPAPENKNLLLADASQGSGGVDSKIYSTKVGKTMLSRQQIAAVKQTLISNEPLKKALVEQGTNKNTDVLVRTEEDVTLIFDQNKGKLFSLYNRARRKNPGLKGKIILQLTIAPSGKVKELRVISSELNDKDLESKLLKRIRGFNFGKKNVEMMTVIYPIEFLPS